MFPECTVVVGNVVVGKPWGGMGGMRDSGDEDYRIRQTGSYKGRQGDDSFHPSLAPFYEEIPVMIIIDEDNCLY